MLKEFLKYCEKQVKDGAIYCWSGQGQIATEQLIKKYETSTTNANRAIKLLKARTKVGKHPLMFDCSGLICKALEVAEIEKKGFDTTADGLYKTYSTKLSNKKQLLAGDLVFRVKDGKAYHVGVVTEDGKVIEAYGRDKGVIKRTINASGMSYWNAFGRLKKLAKEVKEVAVPCIKRLLKHTSPMMKGEDVRAVQQILINKGYSLGNCGADGEFGSKTAKAVKTYQKDHKLTADGIVGENTALSLGIKFGG